MSSPLIMKVRPFCPSSWDSINWKHLDITCQTHQKDNTRESKTPKHWGNAVWSVSVQGYQHHLGEWYYPAMHDTGKVFFSLFCWRVVPKQEKYISVRKNFLRRQRNRECFSLIEGFRNSDDRPQNTEAWCLYFSKFCAKKKKPRLMGQKIKKKNKPQNQRQEAVLHTDTPHPTAPNIKEVEISKF